MVNTILQDSEGYMWFGTNYGLSKYDGYQFHNFQYNIGDSLDLSNNMITSLVEDENQNLWIGTRQGLNKYNRDLDKIERILDFEQDNINALILNNKNELLIGTLNNGLYLYSLTTQQKTHFLATSDSTSLSSNVINCILKDKQHGIIVGTKGGLDIFNPQNNSFSTVLPEGNISCLAHYQDQSVFIGVLSGGFYYSWNKDKLVKHQLPEGYGKKSVNRFLDLGHDQWFAIKEGGVLCINSTSNEQHLLSFDKYNADGISSNGINCIYEDLLGNIWIATFDAGVNYYEVHRKEFNHISDNFLPNGLRNNRIRAIYQDSDEDIWIGSKLNGTLSKFNCDSLSFTHYNHNPNNPSSLSNGNIFCITEYKPGLLWVGTSYGLNLFDKSTGKSKPYFNEINNRNSIRSNVIYSLLQDGDDLYIGHVVAGLDVFNTRTNTIKNYFTSNKKDGLTNGKVRVIYKDSKNNIWIGTANGLNLFDKESGSFQRFLHNENDSNSISNNNILSINEDAQQNLWIGTALGLNLMDREKSTFTLFSTKDGLADNTINAIYPDTQNNLWLSTHYGISKFNPKTKSVSNYDATDGICANELSTYVHCKTKNGEIYFGSNSGFTLFDPNKIIDNKVAPNVVLTDFKIANKKVDTQSSESPLDKHISQCDEITLTYKQTFISFDYVALNYSSSEKNQYAYRLEGFDSDKQDWNYVGSKREATYTNLPPGSYVFRVIASNNDGIWNTEGVALKIKVLPPPWLTWWAYIIYGCVFFVILFLLRSYIIKRTREEKELEQSQQNLQFFLNVSHELRTPLTLLLNPIRKILTSDNLEKTKDEAKQINVSANKLMHLTNQLLDYGKTDVGHLPLKVYHINLVDYTRQIIKVFEGIASSKEISIQLTTSKNTIDVWVDPDKYEKILNNLISNAIKYSKQGDAISIHLSIADELMNSQVRNKKHLLRNGFVNIEVKDTGIGLSKDQVKNVFKRFYSGDHSNTGTGIGLHYTQSLANLHGGAIDLISQQNKGSTFSVYLPLGKNHLSKKEICNESFNIKEYTFDYYNLESLQYDINSVDKEGQIRDAIVAKNNQKRPVLLLIEDNKQLRKQLREELQSIYTIKEAANGKDGWDKIQKAIPDLIVSDVMMPVMDGIELCKSVKSDINTCHIPLILLTARGMIEHKLEGFEIGADEYIPKPFHMQFLRIRIQNLLESRLKLKEKFMSSSSVISAKAKVTNNQEDQFLDKVNQIILENIKNQEFGITELQDKMGMSRTNFYLKISALTATSPSNFIRTVRLKYAAELLTKDQYRVNEICFLAGFKNASYFNQVFKETYQLTPLQYRKREKIS